MTAEPDDAALVVVILLTEPGQAASGAVRSVEQIGPVEGVRIDVAVRGAGQTMLDHVQALQAQHAGSHILLLHESVVVPSTFLESVRSQIRLFADRAVPWGVIGNSGVTFPYFKPVRNLLVAGPPVDRFAGVLPAAQLDPHLLLIHRDVDLSAFVAGGGCPADAPVGDLAILAAWEAEKPCWICNLPVYVEGAAQATGDSGAWAHYLATRYNNTSFVSSFGTIGLSGHAPDAKDFYYSQAQPVLNRATRHLDTASVTVFVFATYYDPAIFDRCLMSVVSQFHRPEALHIIGLDRLDGPKRDAFRDIVERYRHYLPIHWADEDLPGTAAVDQFRACLRRAPDDGYSILAYDTFVLFPQAVSQIREFLKLTLRDPHVLPITTAEFSRVQRTVEMRFGSQPQTYFREVEKLGFSHKERWLSSEPGSTLHFTFLNRFLRETPLGGVDFLDLGSCLPPRLLSEPLSFFLIERGSGYMSFQKLSTDKTVSPLTEAATPFHLANKAGALMAARSNVVHYATVADGIVPSLSYRDEDEAARRQHARLAELEAHCARAEHELVEVRGFSDRQEASLNRFRGHWYFRTRRRLVETRRALWDMVRSRR